MKLGFVTAILADLSLADVLQQAKSYGYDCIEVMCWPPGKAERRYAGVTHLNVEELSESAIPGIRKQLDDFGISISSLGYYPNPLAADPTERQVAADHLRRVVVASNALGIGVVTTFIGRDPTKSIDDNWITFEKVFPPLVHFAADHDVRIAIENCPMFFTADEWPGGKNLAISPAVWRRMFTSIPDRNFGLNYDPSHLVWQQMDPIAPITAFADRIFHVHAKDVRIDRDRLDDVGILATPLEYHAPKLPGLGDVDWSAFFKTLNEIGYDGPVCVEVEDRDFEDSIASRQRALQQSAAFLRPWIGSATQ